MFTCFRPALAALVWLAGAGSAIAQAPNAASAAAPAASRPLAYRSVFDGYRPFQEPPRVAWREANDTVGRIGGWQAYARESPAAPAAGQAAPAPPPASAAGAHAGHRQP